MNRGKINVGIIKHCYGCGACSASCNKNIISIELNSDGFYEPRIAEQDKCTECGICLEVCAFNHKERALATDEIHVKSWDAWSNDEHIRSECSSGGIGFEIGKQLIEKGYKAAGCRYNVQEQRAEHYIATSVEEFMQSVGSKYIQSYTGEAFSQVRRKGEKYLITGTPCQIDSFRRYIRKFRCEENFVLIDFYCHSVPSMLLWNKAQKEIKSTVGTIETCSWRNKRNGWHDGYAMTIKGVAGSYNKSLAEGDLFLHFFLSDTCSNRACSSNCKYKYDRSSADIRIGDMWGKTFSCDEKGVSALISFTDKGYEIVQDLKGCTLIEYPLDIVAEGQMRVPFKAPLERPLILWLMKTPLSLKNINKVENIIRNLINRIKGIR